MASNLTFGKTTSDKVTIKPDLAQLRDLLKAINAMDQDSKIVLKDKVQSISSWTATQIRQAASAHKYYPAQAEIVASTIRANRDRLPNVTIGGSRGLKTKSGASAGQILFGNEFGMDRNTQGTLGTFPNGGYKFPQRSDREGRGNIGYYIFPTLKSIQPDIVTMWTNAVELVYSDWKKGAGGGLK